MSSLTRPRGPLPRRVYWVRRLLVLGTALALVVGIANLLRLGSDGSSPGGGKAVQAAADQSSSPAAGDSATTKSHHRRVSHKPTKTPLPSPDGPCEPGDIVLSPVVEHAAAGGEVTIRLQLSTRTSPACTWHLSSDSLTYKITSGADSVWSSLECPQQVPTKDLVLRHATVSWTSIPWSSQRSEPGCPAHPGPDWAMPGWYHVSVAAFDGEPTDVQFKLRYPVADTITASPSPSRHPSSGSTAKPGSGSTRKPGSGPTKKPSSGQT